VPTSPTAIFPQGLVIPAIVIPAKAGIHFLKKFLKPGFPMKAFGNDELLTTFTRLIKNRSRLPSVSADDVFVFHNDPNDPEKLRQASLPWFMFQKTIGGSNRNTKTSSALTEGRRLLFLIR